MQKSKLVPRWALSQVSPTGKRIFELTFSGESICSSFISTLPLRLDLAQVLQAQDWAMEKIPNEPNCLPQVTPQVQFTKFSKDALVNVAAFKSGSSDAFKCATSSALPSTKHRKARLRVTIIGHCILLRSLETFEMLQLACNRMQQLQCSTAFCDVATPEIHENVHYAAIAIRLACPSVSYPPNQTNCLCGWMLPDSNCFYGPWSSESKNPPLSLYPVFFCGAFTFSKWAFSGVIL